MEFRCTSLDNDLRTSTSRKLRKSGIDLAVPKTTMFDQLMSDHKAPLRRPSRSMQIKAKRTYLRLESHVRPSIWSRKVKTRMTLDAVSASLCDGWFRFAYILWVFVLFLHGPSPHLHSFILVIDGFVLMGSIYLLSHLPLSSPSPSRRFRVLHISSVMPTMPLNDYTNDLHSFRCFLILYFGLYYPVNHVKSPSDFIFFITIAICFAFILHVTRIRAWTIVQYHSDSRWHTL